MLDWLSEPWWWDWTLFVGAGLFFILVFQGIDFGIAVTYARRNPDVDADAASRVAKESAATFLGVVGLLALTWLLWPVYVLVGLIALGVAMYNLCKNLIHWTWKELQE